MAGETETERQRRLAYRARVREWQSFLDTVGRRGGRIPPDYPQLPPPPDVSLFHVSADDEAAALEALSSQGPRPGPEHFVTEPLYPDEYARIIRQNEHGISPASLYHEMIAGYREQYGELPFSDEAIRQAAGFVGPGATRGSWRNWDVYTFPTWADALAYLRPQARGLTTLRRPVMVNAGGVLRAWEGTRYVTALVGGIAHGWVNVEPSRLATEIIARSGVIQLEIAAKLSVVEAVALYIHK